ncbi:MAG TPA: peptidylprolyl isomerase [Methylomirabilota bacterium]|nr:peptidylprolyl isomerase [Methylomirabilota bacterium]
MTALLALAVAALLLSGCGTASTTAAPEPAPPPAAVAPPKAPEPAAPRSAEASDVTDRIVAVVNNDAITLGEVQETVMSYRQENRGRVTGSDEELARQFLTRLIETRLQLQEADREKIFVDDSEVDEELSERMKRFGATNQAQIETLVREQGLSLDAVRKRVRETVRIAKVIRRKVTLRISVTEQEIDRYLADNRAKLETGLPYHARHILITPADASEAAWEAARIRAEMIREQLAAGADFAELARQHSRDASARDGGDLGTLKRGELAAEIEARILALGEGQDSAPYRSALGYHLFRLESKQTLEGEALQRIRQQAREILFRQKYEARLEEWLKEVKQRAIVEVRM